MASSECLYFRIWWDPCMRFFISYFSCFVSPEFGCADDVSDWHQDPQMLLDIPLSVYFVFANMYFCICKYVFLYLYWVFFFGCADRAADWHRGPQMLLAVPSSVSRLTITMPPNVSWLTSLIPMYPNVSQCILINSPDTKPLCRRRRVKYNCHFGWTPIGEIAAKTKKLRFDPN